MAERDGGEAIPGRGRHAAKELGSHIMQETSKHLIAAERKRLKVWIRPPARNVVKKCSTPSYGVVRNEILSRNARWRRKCCQKRLETMAMVSSIEKGERWKKRFEVWLWRDFAEEFGVWLWRASSEKLGYGVRFSEKLEGLRLNRKIRRSYSHLLH